MWGTRMFVLVALVALLTLSVAAADTTVAADGSAVDRTPVILIADPGIDDAAALLLAASSPLFELVGVVSSFGCHSDVARTSANARRVLRYAGRRDVPVCVGPAKPLGALAPLGDADGRIVHGDDALGDVGDDEHGGGDAEGGAPCPGDVSGVEFLVAQARARPGELTLVATGPLTALALALQLEPRLPALVAGARAMGGALARAGNVSPLAEANFAHDALAARLVVASFGRALALYPLDVTHAASFTPARREALRRSGGGGRVAARFFADAVALYQRRYAEVAGFVDGGAPLHDAHPIAALMAPALYEHAETRLAVVVARPGDVAHGAVVVDRRPKPSQVGADGEATVLVARAVDADGFLELVVSGLAAIP